MICNFLNELEQPRNRSKVTFGKFSARLINWALFWLAVKMQKRKKKWERTDIKERKGERNVMVALAMKAYGDKDIS